MAIFCRYSYFLCHPLHRTRYIDEIHSAPKLCKGLQLIKQLLILNSSLVTTTISVDVSGEYQRLLHCCCWWQMLMLIWWQFYNDHQHSWRMLEHLQEQLTQHAGVLSVRGTKTRRKWQKFTKSTQTLQFTNKTINLYYSPCHKRHHPSQVTINEKITKDHKMNISFGFGFYVNRLNIDLGYVPRIASIHYICLYLGPHHVESWKVYHKFPNNQLWLWTVHCDVLPPRQVGGGVFLVIIILWCQRVKTSEV